MRTLSLQLCLITLSQGCMNNQGWAAEILISPIVSREICFVSVGHFGAYRLFVEYVVVYSQGKTMPSLQSLAGTHNGDTHNAVVVCTCAEASLLCMCV